MFLVEITPKSLIEISILASVLYFVISFLRESRGFSIVIFLLLFFSLSNLLSSYLNLQTINLLVGEILEIMTLIIIVVFHPEIRRALTRLGTTSKYLILKKKVNTNIELILNAAFSLAKEKIGALIVLERTNYLKSFIDTGIELDSKISINLIKTIFCTQTPLHDGAIIIRDNKIVAASCFLPLTQNNELPATLGTRHRAGIGITEETDCLCLIVSEEKSHLSIAINGEIFANLKKPEAIKLIEKAYNNEKA